MAWTPRRIRAVETGACPHTAIRDDVTANLLAVEDLEEDFEVVDLGLVESGGDNLTATFSLALVDAQILVLDVAGGDVAQKGGPGIVRADLLVLNKTDLAPMWAWTWLSCWPTPRETAVPWSACRVTTRPASPS